MPEAVVAPTPEAALVYTNLVYLPVQQISSLTSNQHVLINNKFVYNVGGHGGVASGSIGLSSTA